MIHRSLKRTLSQTLSTIVICASMAAPTSSAVAGPDTSKRSDTTVSFHTLNVDGVNILYREAGPKTAPAIVLLHGFPTPSQMFRNLLHLLADRYHVIAPDYPAFGQSDAPAPADFSYAFDKLAAGMDVFVTRVGLTRYSLYLADYGAPIVFRIAAAHPERVRSIIIQRER